MKILKIATTLAAAGLLAACGTFSHAPDVPATMQQVRVNIFPGGFNWPIWVGQERGFFANNRIEVKTIDTPNSREQLTGLINGNFEIAMTAVDNLLAYREGQGAVPVPYTHLTLPTNREGEISGGSVI